MKRFDQFALILLIVAGINWGLWGLFEFNLVYYIFGHEWIDRIFYVIFGLAGLFMALSWNNIGFRVPKKK